MYREPKKSGDKNKLPPPFKLNTIINVKQQQNLLFQHTINFHPSEERPKRSKKKI